MPDDQKTATDILIEDIWAALPATTVEEIAFRVGRPRNAVSNALTVLRKNVVAYGWLVPFIKRGRPAIGETDRIVALSYEHDKNEILDDQAQVHINKGLESSLLSARTLILNAAAICELVLTYQSSISIRRRLKSRVRDLTYNAEKLDETIENMRDTA